ncbi:MAG: V-type ATP synthase subunit F [Thermochromatium sp.]
MDTAIEPHHHPTRLLFLGEETLADGFRLIGFETYPNPTPEEADRLLRDLRRTQTKAFVVVDDALMAQQIPNLHRVRQEGGRIVVIAVPALGPHPRLTSEVAQRLSSLFGTATLETAASGERGSS